MWKRWSFKPNSEPPVLRTSADEEALAEYVYSKVIYQAGVDFESKPMVVICACNLPNPADVNYDRILSRILQKLDIFVESDYTVVLFAGGAKYNPAKYVPITQIDIPPAVYEYNLKFEDKITLPNLYNYDEDGHLMFGVPIERLMGTEGENGLPRVVKDCVAYIRSEGVFRRSPSSVLLRQAKEAYDRGNPVNLKDYGVHVAAVLLKMFFNALPVPVFPVETYDTLKQILHKPNYLGRIEFIRSSVFPLLSPVVILVLRYVCALLVDISKHKNENLMTPHNLAVMFAPNLVHSGNPVLDVSMCVLKVNDDINGGGVGILMKLAIEHFDIMFEGYEDLSNRIRPE
ncbi:31555_t:CDS:2, partial [Racocetra persica]